MKNLQVFRQGKAIQNIQLSPYVSEPPADKRCQFPEIYKLRNEKIRKHTNLSKSHARKNYERPLFTDESSKDHYMDQPRPEVRSRNNNPRFHGPPSKVAYISRP